MISFSSNNMPRSPNLISSVRKKEKKERKKERKKRREREIERRREREEENCYQ
jgi:hypothetical protein